jgi:hypothetical protein
MAFARTVPGSPGRGNRPGVSRMSGTAISAKHRKASALPPRRHIAKRITLEVIAMKLFILFGALLVLGLLGAAIAGAWAVLASHRLGVVGLRKRKMED